MSDRSVMQTTINTATDEVFLGPTAKLTARGPHGRFAILPNHADAVTPLLTGIVALTLPDGSERFLGIDDGLLVKQSRHVRVCVFRAAPGASLGDVATTVVERFDKIEDRERRARTALARLEVGAMRRFAELLEPGP